MTRCSGIRQSPQPSTGKDDHGIRQRGRLRPSSFIRCACVAVLLASGQLSLTASAASPAECQQPKAAEAVPASECNIPPRVGISVSAVTTVAPATIHISVSAVSYGGDFTSLWIYTDRGTLISLSDAELKQYNSDGLLDYNYTWTNVGAGTYQIWAGVQSNLGSISKKEAITVTGDDEQPQPPPPPPPQLSLLLTRHYVYDANQQLCKAIEPETGATVYTYDGAGNLAWSASGLNLADPGNCNRNEAYASSRVVLRAYDSRNRLTDLSFPDGVGDQQWLYARDGLPEQVSTVNGSDGFRDTIINTYSYNRRRLLTRETQELSGNTNAIDYGYSANGDLSRLSYPSGGAVDYAPNALGQPTRAGGYATGVRYHANGAIASFTYGNGLTHNMTQNARQLPGAQH